MKGLTTHQATQQLKHYGRNVISEQKKQPLIFKLLNQFNNLLILLLIGAAALSFVINEPLDGGLILTIVILNALFGFYQELKAEQSIAALKKMTVTKVRVVRDGQEAEIDSQLLVPGDYVYLEEGNKVPADCRVVESLNLEINEAALTGESLPIEKIKSDLVYSGTIVSKGRGRLEVLKTGMNTKFGEIAKNLSVIDDSKTPLQKKLEDLTRLIGIIGIIISILVFILSLLRGDGYFPGFLLAVSLAVAVVPEGLPAVMTITLAIGVKEMAKKKSIMRKLSAIEALGSVSLIATDKTGTLTTNKMRVKEVFVDNRVFEHVKLPSLSDRPFSLLVLDGILCSTASLVHMHDHGRIDVLGDPTEGALLYLSQEAGLILDMVRNEWKLIEEKPFDSVSKTMTVKVEKRAKKEETFIFSKGAPESIVANCDRILIGHTTHALGEKEKEKIEKQVEKWAKKGLRILAFSYSHGPNIKHKLCFLGMVAIHDAPRPEVLEAVMKAKRAGVKVIMITGDNEKTAEAIGVACGIVKEGDDILVGQQIDDYNDRELMAILPRVKIFARTNPFQKHRIVKLYQQLGEIVAVTGDGVNDAIALKQADVGIAMGLVGTDVARETADMVITDDNFATIVNALEEGRNIIKNLKNSIKYLLSCNMTEAIALIGSMIFGINHLFYPIQFLYINLVTDGLPALSLAFSPKDKKVMTYPPEQELTILKPFDKKYILAVGLWGTILVISGYFIWGKTAAFTILTLIQSFILIDLWLSHHSLHHHFRELKKPIFLASFIFPFITQYVIVKFNLLATVFKITPVSLILYLQFIVFASMILAGIKLIKKLL